MERSGQIGMLMAKQYNWIRGEGEANGAVNDIFQFSGSSE